MRNSVAANSILRALVVWRLMISLMTRWWCHDESRLELDLWRHRVGCHLYNCGWHDESSPSNPPFQMSSGHTSSSIPPSLSSSGDLYFYLARSSPIMINSRSRWPGWPSAPPRVMMTPDPESSSPEARSHLDWDPRSEVPTEVGDEVYGRYVDRFPFNCLRETDWHSLGCIRLWTIKSLPCRIGRTSALTNFSEGVSGLLFERKLKHLLGLL